MPFIRKVSILVIVFLLASCAQAPSQDISDRLQPMDLDGSQEVSGVDQGEPQDLPSLVQDSPDPCEVSLDTPSLQQLICDPVEGSNFSLDFVESRTAFYTRYAISYRADGLNLSGVMLIPVGEGPFPLVLTNHGYIDPRYYTRGRGLKREQDALARNGFAVLHPDYRNHAESDKDPDNALSFRLGYVKDVIGAVKAVQSSQLPELSGVDSERVGMIGHSMGGGISMQLAVVEPDLIDALVLYASVSSRSEENLQRYFLSNGNRSEVVEQLYERYGDPETAPAFWEGLSAFPRFDQLRVPVLVFIGTADESVEPQWSYDLVDELKRLNKDVELVEYEAAPHEFIRNFPDFRDRFVEFFQQL